MEDLASKFINGELVNIAPVSVFSSPGGSALGVAVVGSYLGTITSYIQKGTQVWWELRNGKFSANALNKTTYVLHGSGLFDIDSLTTSIRKYELEKAAEVNEAANKRIEAAREKNSFLDFGYNLTEGITGLIDSVKIFAIWAVLILVAINFLKRR